MASEEVRLVEGAAPAGEGQEAPAELDWFLTMLQAAMTEVMEGESTPLQKANAVARLGSLYLKSYQTRDLERENRELAGKVDALEQHLAELETMAHSAPAAVVASEVRRPSVKLSRSRTRPPRGLIRATRHSARTDDERLPLAPPETGYPLQLADEVEITMAPDSHGPPEEGNSR